MTPFLAPEELLLKADQLAHKLRKAQPKGDFDDLEGKIQRLQKMYDAGELKWSSGRTVSLFQRVVTIIGLLIAEYREGLPEKTHRIYAQFVASVLLAIIRENYGEQPEAGKVPEDS